METNMYRPEASSFALKRDAIEASRACSALVVGSRIAWSFRNWTSSKATTLTRSSGAAVAVGGAPVAIDARITNAAAPNAASARPGASSPESRRPWPRGAAISDPVLCSRPVIVSSLPGALLSHIGGAYPSCRLVRSAGSSQYKPWSGAIGYLRVGRIGGPPMAARVTPPLLAALFAVAGLAGWAMDASAQIPGDTVKIGVLSDFSGPFADQVGRGSLVGAELAAEDFAKEVGGLKVEIVSADHQNKPDIGVAIARRWVDEEGVDAIVDLANSGVGLAVNTLVHEKNRAMLASATATSDLTGRFCQPTTVQWALDTWARGNAVGRTITKMGGSTWFFISFDYALGKALQRDATEAIIKAGGSVLGSVSHPLGATDFGSYLLQAQASGAKVIALADTGADAINAIRQAAEFQIVGPDRRLAALFLQITDVDALGLNAAQGLILSEAFYWDLNDQTRAFASRFAERMGGKMPTEDQAAAYSATLAYLRAVKAAGTIEGDRVLAEMKKSPIDDPLFGHVVVRADGRATHAMYVFKVKSPQQSKSRFDVYDLIETIPPETAFRPLDQGGCPLVK